MGWSLERYGGTVEKFIVDAVMAVFGAPTAREDDPERAVRAALAVREANGELDRALAFYRSVGPTRYIREAEALHAASA